MREKASIVRSIIGRLPFVPDTNNYLCKIPLSYLDINISIRAYIYLLNIIIISHYTRIIFLSFVRLVSPRIKICAAPSNERNHGKKNAQFINVQMKIHIPICFWSVLSNKIRHTYIHIDMIGIFVICLCVYETIFFSFLSIFPTYLILTNSKWN